MAAAGGAPSGSQGNAALRVRSLDTEGIRLGIRAVHRFTVQGYETVAAKPFENRHVLDRIPDFYERLKSSYDEKFFRQEVMGEYLDLAAGRVYYSFDRSKHIQGREPDPNHPLLWALDFNVSPMSSVVAQVIHGYVWVHDEIVLARASTQDACEEFTQRFARHPAGFDDLWRRQRAAPADVGKH